MTHTIHVVKKDVRHLRWELAIWAAIVAAHATFEGARPWLELQGSGPAIVAGQLGTLLSVLELVMTVLIASRIVHEDPAVGLDAFWLTRPVGSSALAAAKLALALGALVLLPLVAETATMAAFRVGGGGAARAMPPLLISRTAWVLALTAAAVLTPSLGRLFLVVVAVAGTYMLFLSAILAGAILFTTIESSAGRPEVYDPIPSIAGQAIAIGIALWVVVSQYRHRRRRRNCFVAAAGLVGMLACSTFWPWTRTSPDPDPGPWAHDPSASPVVVEKGAPSVSEEFSLRRRRGERKQIAMPIRLANLPPDVSVTGIGVQSRLEVGGGALVSAAGTQVSVRIPAGSVRLADRNRPLQAALGNVRMLPRGEEDSYDQWPVVVVADEDAFARYARTPGRLTGTLDFHVARAVASPPVPLATGGAMSEPNRRLEIVRVDRHIDGCSIVLREISINPLFALRAFEREEFVLTNPSRGEAIGLEAQMFSRAQASPLSFLLGAMLGMSEAGGSGGRGFNVQNQILRYPGAGAAASARPAIDGAWLDGAQLVRVTTKYAGHVSRPFAIERFTMIE